MNKDNPLVSIAMVSYNQEEFIEEAVVSACRQSYENFEVVVSDDGSKDKTLEILNLLVQKFPTKLKVISDGNNLGITGNCNRVLNNCSGEFIVFMGGDDVLAPTKVEKQVEWFKKSSKRVLCGHLIDIINNNSQVTGVYKSIKKSGKGCSGWIRRGVYFGALSIMVRKSAIPRDGFDIRIPHASDWKFYMDCIGKEGEFGYVNEVLGQYRKHDNNITNMTSVVMNDVIETINILESEYTHFQKDVLFAQVFMCIYGKGVFAETNGDKDLAKSYYLESIKKRPFLFKSYLRLLRLYFI